jgi:hypothetical protein
MGSCGHNLTTDSMATYFAFALAAAHINRKTDAQQSMRLDDLSSSSFTTHTDNQRDFPSSGLGAHAAPIPMNNFGITFIDATPGSGIRQPKTARDQESSEDEGAHANPFTDPANLLRDDEESQAGVAQDPENRQWR